MTDLTDNDRTVVFAGGGNLTNLCFSKVAQNHVPQKKKYLGGEAEMEGRGTASITEYIILDALFSFFGWKFLGKWLVGLQRFVLFTCLFLVMH